MTRARTLLLSLLGLGILAAAILLWSRWSRDLVGEPGDDRASTTPDGGPVSGDPNRSSTASSARDAQLSAHPDGRTLDGTRRASGDGTTKQVRLTGRVVDDRRRPVPGANVTVRLLGSMPVSGASGADGRFALDAALAESRKFAIGSLRVVDGAGRAALAAVYDWPPSIELGTIELVTAFPLSVRVIDGGQAVHDATVRAWTVESAAGLVRIDDGVTDAHGEMTLAGLPPGTMLLLATAPNGRRARATVRLTDEVPELLTIALGPERTLDVVVTEADERPVPGAIVELKALQEQEGGFYRAAEYDPAPAVAPQSRRK